MPVQVAVDTAHHLIITHEVTNVGTDRSQLSSVAKDAKAALGVENLDAIADRGYFSGEQILACEKVGIAVTLPKPMTSRTESGGYPAITCDPIHLFGCCHFVPRVLQDFRIHDVGRHFAVFFTFGASGDERCEPDISISHEKFAPSVRWRSLAFIRRLFDVYFDERGAESLRL